jgi:hypothetical protein
MTQSSAEIALGSFYQWARQSIQKQTGLPGLPGLLYLYDMPTDQHSLYSITVLLFLSKE